MIQHSKPYISKKDIKTVEAVMKSGFIARGCKVSEFEAAIADYFNLKKGFATGSGTAALILALKALKIGHGDEVVLPTYVCRSVFDAVITVGAEPVLCDIGKHWNMTPETVEPVLSKKTKAIIVVHIFGIAEDSTVFKRFNVPIIEDCCQAFGALVNGRLAGTAGDICVFSFHATKCLTTGEGGMALSNNPEINSRMLNAIQNKRIASPMTDIQAALGLCQLSRYGSMLKKRKSLGHEYLQRLPAKFTDTVREVRERSIFFRFPILIDKEFDKIKMKCDKNGFAVRKGVDSLIHRQQKLPDKKFPIATGLFNTTVSLPIYPELSYRDVNQIIPTICELAG